MLRTLVKFVLLAEAFAVGTFAVGWWSVPILAAAWALAAAPDAKPVRSATICATAGWCSLLLLDATRGPIGRVGTQLAGVMLVPFVALIVITLLYPALLALSASTVAAAFRSRFLAHRVAQAAAELDLSSSGESSPSGGDIAIADA
jgi:hypothetical protein